MSQLDYNAKLPQIKAIAPDAIKKPGMPVRVYLQEAENLLQWCQEDLPALVDAGLDPAIVNDMPQLIGALREAESRWFSLRFSLEAAQKQWKRDSPKAYALRDHLLRAMRHAYRNDVLLMKRVAEIANGTSQADMIQDLSDIARLGHAFFAPLATIKLKQTVLDDAETTADAMAILLAQVNGERKDNSKARILRDQAFTLLKYAVDEVRACGKYALWDNEVRRKGYASRYFRANRHVGGTAGLATEVTTELTKEASSEPETEAQPTCVTRIRKHSELDI